MSKLNLKNFAKSIEKAAKEHSPQILVGLGICGMISATVAAVTTTPKAIRLIEDKKAENKTEKLTAFEVAKTTYICYVPTVILSGVGIACIIGANSISVRRQAALATAYSISEAAMKDYKEKVIEVIGDKKERTIRDSIAKDKIDKDPISKKEVIMTGKGETLCYDVHSGRYFKSDIEKIKRIVNELNRRMMSETYITLNEFYYEIGLSTIPLGEELGWNIDDGLIVVDFSSQLAEDGTPCLVIDYSAPPRYYYKYVK